MRIEVEEKGNNAIVAIAGDLDYNSYSSFNDKILELVDKDFKKIVVDMSSVGHIDSMGLGAVTRLWKTAGQNNSELSLACVPKNVGKLINLINLDQRIKVFDDVKNALA